MAQILVVDDDPGAVDTLGRLLRAAGYEPTAASSGAGALALIEVRRFDAVVCDVRLMDMSGLDVLRRVRQSQVTTPFVLVTGYGTLADAVEALRLGAADYLEKPVFEDDLLRAVGRVCAPTPAPSRLLAFEPAAAARRCEPHALRRWAAAVIPVIDCPSDPRTMAAWGRWVAASPGALRSWCRMARLGPRRSLLFARLLRAVHLADDGRHRLENLLDVVDHRTLAGLLRTAGFTEHDWPRDLQTFVQRQALVTDPEARREASRTLERRLATRPARQFLHRS